MPDDISFDESSSGEYADPSTGTRLPAPPILLPIRAHRLIQVERADYDEPLPPVRVSISMPARLPPLPRQPVVIVEEGDADLLEDSPV